MLILAMFSIIVWGCKQRLDYWNINYPAEVEYQIDLFKQYAPDKVRAKKLTIVLTGQGIRNADGTLCAGLASPKDRKIYLDTTSYYWKNAKTTLVLHELGHYVLDRRHHNNYFVHPAIPELELPVSVMNIEPDIKEEWMTDKIDLQHYYLNELFSYL